MWWGGSCSSAHGDEVEGEGTVTWPPTACRPAPLQAAPAHAPVTHRAIALDASTNMSSLRRVVRVMRVPKASPAHGQREGIRPASEQRAAPNLTQAYSQAQATLCARSAAQATLPSTFPPASTGALPGNTYAVLMGRSCLTCPPGSSTVPLVATSANMARPSVQR